MGRQDHPPPTKEEHLAVAKVLEAVAGLEGFQVHRVLRSVGTLYGPDCVTRDPLKGMRRTKIGALVPAAVGRLMPGPDGEPVVDLNEDPQLAAAIDSARRTHEALAKEAKA